MVKLNLIKKIGKFRIALVLSKKILRQKLNLGIIISKMIYLMHLQKKRTIILKHLQNNLL